MSVSGMGDVPVARTVPLRGMQRTVAQRLLAGAQQTAHVTAMAEVDAAPLLARLTALRRDHPALTLTPLLVKAAALCLRRHPRLNATLLDDTVYEWAEVNVAVALSLPSDDLVVATLRRADERTAADLAADLAALRARAEAGKLTMMDVRGGTFTLSNYGMLRHVVWATPIISPGQTAVLGVGRATPRLAADAADGYTVRPILPLSLTYDHRVVNGVPAGRFLDDLGDLLEAPTWLADAGT